MNVKKKLVLLVLGMSLSTTILASNKLDVYVSQNTKKCVAFNLVKIDPPKFVRTLLICPGKHSSYKSLPDGHYDLYGTEVDATLINPYGDNEFIADPIELTHSISQAIVYPSEFKRASIHKDG